VKVRDLQTCKRYRGISKTWIFVYSTNFEADGFVVLASFINFFICEVGEQFLLAPL